MEVSLMNYSPNSATICGMAAAVCTDSNNFDSAMKHAVESGHTSVLEHVSFTFQVEGLSRAALAQLTRHRLASFDVQSQRYVKLDKWEAVVPDTICKSELRKDYETCLDKCMELYSRLMGAGIPAEDARYITPQCITTKLIMTMNARELLHFFSLRTCNRAQWEIRELADRMLIICRTIAPDIFKYAGPGCVTGQCPEKHSCGHPRSNDDWNTVRIRKLRSDD